MEKDIALKIKAVKEIAGGKGYQEVADELGVHTRTLRRWYKRYQRAGVKGLKREGPWNKTPKNIENRVFLLKEQEPWLTLSRAKVRLQSAGIQMSLEGIRKIWQRYGLTGFDKEKLSHIFIQGITPNSEVELALSEASEILKRNGDIKHVVRIINSLPVCTNSDLLKKISYRHLGMRRKVEKLQFGYEQEPLHKIYQRAKLLRQKLEKKGLLYSSLRAGLMEANALINLGKPEIVISLLNNLKHKLPKYSDPGLRFLFKINEGDAYAQMLKIREAIECLKECRRLSKVLPNPSFQMILGNLYSNLGMYKEAKIQAEMALSKSVGDARDFCLCHLAGCYAIEGSYLKALKTLNESRLENPFAGAAIPLIRAFCALGQGEVEDAMQFAQDAIKTAKKEHIINYYHASTIILAIIHKSLGNQRKATALLRNATPILEKHKMMRDYFIRKVLTDRIQIPEPLSSLPLFRILLLLKKSYETNQIKYYNRAYKYAEHEGLLGYFARFCFFFPQPILKLIETGKSTGLPKAILQLPIFNNKAPSFRIDFLGRLRVVKKDTFLKVKLRPKDSAFLIRLALAKNFCLVIDEALSTLWPTAKNPKDNLKHLLWRLRRELKISNIYLYVRGQNVYFKGFFINDYQEFVQTLARAKALQRAGEWSFAKKEYLQAFKLFRGEPFKKNFDDWSVDMRFRILSELETEAINFARACLEHNNKRDAKKVLEKVLKIIPDSEEIKELLDSLIV